MGSEIELIQVMLFLVIQPVLMCCCVICSINLNITSLHASVLSLGSSCPSPALYQALGAEVQEHFYYPSSQGETPAVTPAQASKRLWWGMQLLLLDNDLSGRVSMFCLALSLQACCFFSTCLHKILCGSSVIVWKSLLKWKKVFKKGHWTLWRIKPAQSPLEILL